ncbi:putative abc multidrug transporter protein [Phaeoacremonium minimum UCRPA7]|uniref:Putative abc multidrug transporter protein n=1 Tax=Phaeoacremonium minimum (strain UCR-PA7) TaxID=1286976 RepID=R8BV18_PHAM7|nr:putative abc multidrug transporter protein [Phaeoacremonium minimum UCRPA7]EOO03202.1 putative abc multidrug transporter protein [Phaeoacremonium minimum UCRPA7]
MISVYLLVLLLTDSARMRTLALISAGDKTSIAFAFSVALQTAGLAAESVTKSGFIAVDEKKVSPESTGNLFARSTFTWLRKLLLIGYKRVIMVRDLFRLDSVMDSEALAAKFRGFALEKAGKKRKSTTLLFETFWKLKWPIFAAFPARLITMGLTFAQPFLLADTVGLSALPVVKETDQWGYGLIGAFILVYLGLAIASCQYQYKMVRVVTMTRGGLVSLVYARSMNLDPKDQAKAGAALTHMNADIELITAGAFYIHELWSSPVEIAVGIWLVERQLGVACLIPVVIAILAAGATFWLTKRINSAQTAWVGKITERIAMTGVTLNSVTGLKLAGLLDKSLTLLQGIRESELHISKTFRKLLIVNMLLAYVSPVLTPVFTFLLFALVSRSDPSSSLTISRAFSSLALLTVIASPLTMIISMVPTLIVSYNSFNRIQRYCEREEEAPAAPSASLDEKSPPTNSSSNNDLPMRSLPASETSDTAVIIENGYFSWVPGALSGIENVNMVVKKGSFAMILGATGSGKSTILKALVNEVPEARGIVHCIQGAKGYCAQTPWLPAGTAREVIMAGSPVDMEWYRSVTKACQLEEDFRGWDEGDDHPIGSNGAALSGGQKQRVALARCIYSKANLMLLDDSLSGLDVETKAALLEQVFGATGLIRKLNTTVILVSSTREHQALADEVMNTGDAEATPAAAVPSEAAAVAEPPKPVLRLPKALRDAIESEAPVAEAPAAEKVEVMTDAVIAEDTGSSSKERDQDDDESSKGVQEIDRDNARQYGGRGAYKYYIKPITWASLMTFIISIILFTFCQAFPSVWLKMWAEHNEKHPDSQLGLYLGVYAALGVGAIACIVIASWGFFVNIIPQTGSFFHQVLATTVANAPLAALSSMEPGEITSRFSQDLQMIDMELPLATMNTFASVTICIASATIVAVAGRYVAIAFPVVIAILFFIQKFYLRTSRQLRFLELETKGPLYSRFLECISGLSTIQAFGWEEYYERNQWSFLDTSQRAYYLFQCLQRWLTVTIDLVVAMLSIILAIVLIQMRSSIGGGYIAVGLVNIMTFNGQLKTVIMHWTSMEIALGAIARIRGFSTVTENENEGQGTAECPPGWPAKGGIQVKNLTVSYGGRPALRGVSLDILPQEKIAVCGRTGSGKSTLLMCLLRMVDPDHGSSILIDGVDIRTLSRQRVRSGIAYVSQDPVFIMDKVKTNLDPSGEATDEAMIETLTKVGLWEIIQASGGLEMTPMQLLPLSPGQKQLFVLARAMLRPKKIVLLDEPASTVDDATADRIKDLMHTEFRDCTVINVAHRLETIRAYDKVLVLREGSKVAYDSVSAVLESDE